MNFIKKIINSYKKSSEEKIINEHPVDLSLDDLFVHNFINKGGKFIYCTSMNDVYEQLKNIIIENNWKEFYCIDNDLIKVAKKLTINVEKNFDYTCPFFTTCEHLIADNGAILFSSNQLGSHKLSSFSDSFIVYATTSQLVKNTGEGLTGIKTNFKENIPTNICSVKYYSLDDMEDNFLEKSNNNSKNLYLLLFEDL